MHLSEYKKRRRNKKKVSDLYSENWGNLVELKVITFMISVIKFVNLKLGKA